MEIDRITVCGGGILGSQIAWQIASSGFSVTVYDNIAEGIKRCKKFHSYYAKQFKTESPLDDISYTTNLQNAVSNADFVIESIPEDMELKQAFYRELSGYISDNAIITTNSSTITPSKLKDYVKKPQRFLALHFSNPIWDASLAEIMGHDKTDRKIFERVVKFAEEIGLAPIKIYKEQRGYVLNAMLIPWLAAAQHLYFTEVADYRDIDRAWIASTQSKIGPFGIMDIIGLQTIYNVVLIDAKKTNKKELYERAKKIKEQFLDKGKLGLSTNEGFYRYPHPEYENYIKNRQIDNKKS